MIGGSLRFRLVIAGAVSIVLALGLAAVGLSVLFERHVERQMGDELAVVLDRVVAALDRTAEAGLTVADPPDDPRFERPLSGLYWQVTGESGAVIDRSRALWDAVLPLPDDTPAEGTLHRHRIRGPGGATLLAVERRVILPARLGGDPVRVVVARDVADLDAATRAFTRDLLPFLGLVALLLAGASALQIRVGLAPLATVKARLAAIRTGAADRLGSTFPDEVRPLAAEVDALLDQRQAQIEAARTRAADLAHGFKTPLQVLFGDIDRLRQRGAGDIADDLDAVAAAMRRHVEHELARTRRAGSPATARAHVKGLVEQIIDVIKRTPGGDRIAWIIAVPPGLHVRVAPGDLAEMLGNLLENAARHARGRIEVRAEPDGAMARLSVIDDGPGIPPARIPDALRRGGRLDETRSSNGLGLAIVADLAEAWNGALALGPTEPGRMTATLRLPIDAA